MLKQYHYGNSGFDDVLTDACFEMCKERSEWLYLAEQLLAFGGNWDNRLVMNIYRNIGDNDYFADKLKKDFPEKIIEYYFKPEFLFKLA